MTFPTFQFRKHAHILSARNGRAATIVRRKCASCLAVPLAVAGSMLIIAGTPANAQDVNPVAPRTAAPLITDVSARAGYVSNRVYDSHNKQWIDFETLVARANQQNIVLVGEQHDDGAGHAMELALLQGIARRRVPSGGPVVLSLEMFERDVQGALDAYLRGSLDEEAFLKASRPWPNYSDDYRPLVELAKQLKWPVVAANVPRSIASRVSHGGLQALDSINATARADQVAARIGCPQDQYFRNFSAVMSTGGHGGPTPAAATNADSARFAAAAEAAMTQRFYESQCVKDETMGESIARALDRARERGPNALVVHMNGAFHTDFALGTAERAVQRTKDAHHIVISIVPVPDLDNIDAKSMRKRADYLVFTLAKPEAK
jgi:uncharacterized iron-regulated protein